MEIKTAIAKCENYEKENVKEALNSVISALGGLDFIKSSMTVVIKANLVSAMKPERAATTHPELICALCDMLTEKGAKVIIGDSPGGLYNQAFVNRIYNVSGMKEAEKHGAKLNQNFSQSQADNPNGKVLKSFLYTSYLDEADLIINFCKLKSHGMMGMSAAAKNMFGTVPGITKPEYHYRFPDHKDFADMIVDLDEYFKPCLSIVDAVIAMEGNGPTAGTPKFIGAVAASKNPHAVDLLCASLIGLTKNELPILNAAFERGLIPDTVKKLEVIGDYKKFISNDFSIVQEHTSLKFNGKGNNRLLNLATRVVAGLLAEKPKLQSEECVGCNKCGEICPAKAIIIENKKAVINRKKCICCFCCQEFCPKGAMRVHRNAFAKIVTKL